MTELLSAQHINKSFSGVHVLKDVQFSLMAGEVHALLGENGAGKSTLLKTLFGIYIPDSGTLSIGGTPVTLHSPRDAQSHGVAMIHQELALIPELSVAQNVLLGNEGREWLNYAQMEERVRPFLEKVGLNVAPSTPVKRLTIAQQQMVEIARAVARQARIIIMDEPTSSLTTHEIEQLYVVVRELTASGVGIIYVSHHFDEIEALADRVTVLRDGNYIGTVDQRDVTQDQLVTMMVGRELAAQDTPVDRTPGAVRLNVQGLNRTGVFEDISLQVHVGEVVTLAGLIGAGRTEVLRAIYGADSVNSGQIELDGQSVPRPSPAVMMRRGVGFIAEDRRHQGIVPDAKVSVNMMLTSWAKGLVSVREADMRRAVEPQMQALGIRPANPNQTIRRLSGGNQQKVILGRWLAAGCGVLLIDEPTRGIDVASKADIYTLVDELARQGVAVLMVSSELPEVLRLSDRILVMREGRLAGELSRDQASEERILALATGAQTQPMQKTRTSAPSNRTTIIERLREAGILAILLLGAVVFSFTVPSFFSVDNAINGIGLSAAINTVVAIGLTYVIITGGIDLSVGSTAALSAVIGADLMQRGLPVLLAVLVALAVGAVAGLINGLLVTRVQLAPFIVTLGTMTFYRGLALSYTNGQPILSLPDGYKRALGGDVLGLPIPLIAALLLVAAFTLILRYTKTGQYILAIGGNAEAVRLSGINTSRFVTLTYVISGMLAAFAALVLIAQLGAAEPILGSGWELSAIAASVVGGTSLAGGKGNVVGALLGALLLSMLQNVLTLLGVQAFYQLLATGLIIIGAMVIDRYTRGN